MEEQLLELTQNGKYKEVQRILESMSDKQVTSILDGNSRNAEQIVTLVSGIVQGVCFGEPDAAGDFSKCLLVYRRCLSLMQSDRLLPKARSQLLATLVMLVDTLPLSCSTDLLKLFMKLFDQSSDITRSLDLLSKLLVVVGRAERVVQTNTVSTGKEYRQEVIETMCTYRWKPSLATPLVASLKDVTLTVDELKTVTRKAVKMFADMPSDELPPLVYQLVCLSSKGHQQLVLQQVMGYFQKTSLNVPEPVDEDDVTMETDGSDQIMGTVIVHINFAIRQDQDLGREFIKFIKASQQSCVCQVLSPFPLAVALSMAQLHYFQEQVLELLRSSVLQGLTASDRAAAGCTIGSQCPQEKNLKEIILKAVYSSSHGWEHMQQGLVHLGFTLMEMSGGGRGRPRSRPAPLTPTQRAAQIGSEILLNTFKQHEGLQVEILEQLFDGMMNRPMSPLHNHLNLLLGLVRSAPQAVLNCQHKVREILDYVGSLQPSSARGLLRALCPLFRLSMPLRDALILVLRKGLFARHQTGRVIAVEGFMILLGNVKILNNMPLSQPSQSLSLSQVDVHMPYNPLRNEALALEILNNLRRSLTQQADVRLTLYKGLCGVLQQNHELAEAIQDLLSAQVECYADLRSEDGCPLKLDLCIVKQDEQMVLQEPLAQLLGCCIQCVLKLRKAGDTSDSHLDSRLHMTLTRLTAQLIKCDLQDFDLDKTSDFSLATSEGTRNLICVPLMSGVYEQLMEYSYFFGASDDEEERHADVLSLFSWYGRLVALLKEKSQGGGPSKKAGKTGRGATASQAGRKAKPAKSTATKKPPTQKATGSNQHENSCLSLQVLASMIKECYSSSSGKTMQLLEGNVELCRHVLGAWTARVQNISAEIGVWGEKSAGCSGQWEAQLPHQVFTYCCAVARSLHAGYISHIEEGDSGSSPALAALALEGLLTTTHTCCMHFSDRLTDYLKNITSDDEQTEDQAITWFQDEVERHLGGGAGSRGGRQAVAVLQTLGDVVTSLTSDSARVARLCVWLQKLCAEHNADETGVGKGMLAELVKLTGQEKSCAKLIRDISEDIHSVMGDIDQEMEVGDKRLQCVTDGGGAGILIMVLQRAEQELTDTDWYLTRLRAPIHTACPSHDGSWREGCERSISGRLGHLVNTFNELVQSAVPPGNPADSTIRALVHLYTTLSTFSKYWLTVCRQGPPHLAPRFEKLVKLSGTNLSQQVYSFITYIQATQKENLNTTIAKAKGKKKEKSAANKISVIKESRSIPSLIYAMEQYERYLIQLSKRTKVNLMEAFKRSTARDFRINVAALQEEEEEEKEGSESEQEITQQESDDEDDEPAPSNKRPRH